MTTTEEAPETGAAPAAAEKKSSKKTKAQKAVEAMATPTNEYITFEKETFELAIDAIKALCPECRMHIMDKAITVLGVDTANVAMISLTMGSESFLDFNMQPEELGIDCQRFAVGLAAMDDGRVDFVKVSAQKYVLTDGVTRFDYVPLDPNTIRKDPNIPTLELPGRITVDNGRFADAIKAVKSIGEKAEIVLQSNREEGQPARLNIDAEGSVDKLHKEADEIDDGNAKPGPRGCWRSLFSLDYLADMAKIFKSAKGSPAPLRVEVGDDHPIKFMITIAPGISLVYLLAPRIEAD